MSGIVGIVNLDGAPVDRALLRRMTDFLAFRGPDAQEVWCEGAVGFGHAMLRTTFEAEREHQPCTLDGKVWITADARVDARPELKRELEAVGRRDVKDATDVELILHAYHAWGDACVEHLLGDFAFAIWDAPRRRLFCARDHFGVKPFYYARLRLPASAGQPAGAQTLVFSNTLNCVRLHPGVSSELNELAIGDFLLFAYNQDEERSHFSSIQRLPPAHTVSVSAQNVEARRYWTLPIEAPLNLQRSDEYRTGLLDLLREAVTDRLRTRKDDPAAILMSGGIDSTSLAAVARAAIPSKKVVAFTYAFEGTHQCEEVRYSQLAAAHIEMPVEVFDAGRYRLFEGFTAPEISLPAPVNEPFRGAFLDQYRRISRIARVALTGEYGDELFAYSPGYTGAALRGGRSLELLRDLGRYVRTHRMRPPLGVRRRRRRVPLCPSWIEGEFSRRLQLTGRWRQVMARSFPHPYRPDAYDYFTASPWRNALAEYDSEYLGLPLEFRHPLLDLRVVQYSLRLPAFPHCLDKQVLRDAFGPWLPREVLTRPKTSMRDDPIAACLRRSGTSLPRLFKLSSRTEPYVDHRMFEEDPARWTTSPERLWTDCRAVSLDYWMRC